MNFLHLTLTQMTKIKNLSHATTDFVIFQSSSSTILTYVRKFNPAIYAQMVEWLC